jgi:tetratricopeptide (TPR) repeat protein
MRYLFLSLIALLFISCANETPENVAERVDQLIAEDNYTQALNILKNVSAEETDANLSELKEKTYLNYGLYLEYRGPEDSTMRDRMTSALEQYIEVLKINPDNKKARTEIQQIMGIYSTMPDKSPGDEIISQLNGLGFDY